MQVGTHPQSDLFQTNIAVLLELVLESLQLQQLEEGADRFFVLSLRCEFVDQVQTEFVLSAFGASHGILGVALHEVEELVVPVIQRLLLDEIEQVDYEVPRHLIDQLYDRVVDGLYHCFVLAGPGAPYHVQYVSAHQPMLAEQFEHFIRPFEQFLVHPITEHVLQKVIFLRPLEEIVRNHILLASADQFQLVLQARDSLQFFLEVG